MPPKIDPLTIVCDVVIDGNRYKWIGATALYRHAKIYRETTEAKERKT